MYTIHNHPEDMVEEMLAGYIAANPHLFERVPNTKAIAVKGKRDKVMVLTGGGAGCEPIYLGLAGQGMADAVVSGNIFAAPSATAILRTIKHIHHEQGIVMITGNYVGDVLNYELAVELCQYEGIEARAVFVKDDIPHAAKEHAEERRGICGILCVVKAAAGAADAGLPLNEVERIAKVATDAVGTVSVTFWPGYRPETGAPLYQMLADTVELGMGFNGEPGVEKKHMPSADQLAEDILQPLIDDLQLTEEDEILLLVNGKGATSLLELYVLGNSLHRYLEHRRIKVCKTETGNFFTAPGMGGVSVTVMKFDAELKRYYCRDSYTPMYTYRDVKGEWEADG